MNIDKSCCLKTPVWQNHHNQHFKSIKQTEEKNNKDQNISYIINM